MRNPFSKSKHKDKIFKDLTKKEIKLFKSLNTPAKIQEYIRQIPINFEEGEDTCRSPREVIKHNSCHCVEGAVFAAALLRFHGHPALILDLESIEEDWDHAIAPFKIDGCWGAISKTNHSVLRYREPVYKTIRELVMSYFHEYFLQSNGKKTLRKYSRPFNLKVFDNIDWITNSEPLWEIPNHMVDILHITILTRKQIINLRSADKIERDDNELKEYKDPLKRKDGW
jgi:hypothetical protein